MKRQIIYLIILLVIFLFGLGLIFFSIKPAFYSISFPKLKIAILPSPTPVLPTLETAQVKRVIDGDTIELSDNRRLRYIGMDAPEIYFQKTPQCFAQEALIKNKELVEGKTVFLEKDVSENDKYGRLLRYVYLDNDKNNMVNEILVEQGFAYATAYPPDTKYNDKFIEEQHQAKANNLGLWSKCN